MFNDYKSAISWVESIHKFGDKLDLSNIIAICKKFNNPELSLKCIHIAGTNGKGSTTQFVKNILMDKGFSVGAFTSPYIISFNERISINENPISNDDLFKYINIVYPVWEKLYKENIIVTFFEIVTIISFLYFKDMNIDYVVYEVGLGGRLDATNVITPLITAITNISLDHTQLLGSNVMDIATEKLGIVKKNIPLITTVDTNLLLYFKNYCSEVGTSLICIDITEIESIVSDLTYLTYNGELHALGLYGFHQACNARLAIEIVKQLSIKEKFDISTSNIHNGLINVKWPARFEKLNGIIIDGAHNIDGIIALKNALNVKYNDVKINLLFSVMKDKQITKIVSILDSFAYSINFTTFDFERASNIDTIFDLSLCSNKRKILNPAKFIEEYSINKNEILVVCGSLYFASFIRKYIK